jgi:hypothetical protein
MGSIPPPIIKPPSSIPKVLPKVTPKVGPTAAISILFDLLFPPPLSDGTIPSHLKPPSTTYKVPGKNQIEAPGAPPFNGGQSAGIKYKVTVFAMYGSPSPQQVSVATVSNITGAISSINFFWQDAGSGRQTARLYVTGNNSAGQFIGTLLYTTAYTYNWWTVVSRMDGLPDIGGDPAGTPATFAPAPPPVIPGEKKVAPPPKIDKPKERKLPPPPNFEPTPKITPTPYPDYFPSPAPFPFPSPAPFPFPSPAPFPFPSPAPFPSPSPKPSPAPVPKPSPPPPEIIKIPDPTTKPPTLNRPLPIPAPQPEIPIPDKPVPVDCKSLSDCGFSGGGGGGITICPDPDLSGLFELLNQILDRLDVEISGSIDVANCQDEITNYPYSNLGIVGLSSQLNAVSLQLKEMVKIQCEIEPIAAVPEWWQLRPEGNRPQLIVQFGEKKEDGKIGKAIYTLTIPHFSGSKEDAKEINFEWRKGSIEGILTLKDNSKLIVNAVSEQEVEKIFGIAKKWIKEAMLVDSFSKIGQRKGQPFKQITAVAKVARFFPEGTKSEKPDWVVRLDRD